MDYRLFFNWNNGVGFQASIHIFGLLSPKIV